MRQGVFPVSILTEILKQIETKDKAKQVLITVQRRQHHKSGLLNSLVKYLSPIYLTFI